MLKHEPCKVLEVFHSKTWKHGHSKAQFVGIQLFTGKKYEDACPTSHNMEVPVVTKTEHALSMLDESTGAVSVITEFGELKSDLNLPTVVKVGEPTDEDVQLQNTIVQGSDAGKMVTVIVLAACGQEKIIGAKLTD